MSIAIYPGTFDPITYGHIDVAKRASKAFDTLIVVAMNNSMKRDGLFNMEERIELLKKTFEGFDNIRIDSHSGLLVDYLKKTDIHVVVRGLRAVSDFEYEMQMAAANKALLPSLDTFFLMTDTQYSFISSTLVKEIAFHGENIDRWVPPYVKKRIKEKIDLIKKDL